MSERSTVFRLRSSRDRASGSQLQVSGGQRQSDRQDQDSVGRNDGSGNVGRRFAFARGDRSTSETAEGKRSLSSGVRESGVEARTVGAVIKYWQEKGIQVVPAKRGDKFPSIQWREYSQKERLSYSETLELFGGNEDEPAVTYNYAILTGVPSGGLVVLDYDELNRGMEHPVGTFTVATGKGIHYYIRVHHDAPIGNASYRRASFDIRGVGGIAIAPPSQHPSGAIYRVVNDKPILEVSYEWYQKYVANALAGTGETNLSESRVRPDGWFAEAFTETCPQGGRDNLATALVGKLLNHLYSGDVRAIMYVWAETKCDPPLPRQDIDRIVSSLERKRQFDEVQKHTPKPTEEPDSSLPPVSSGPEDEWFRGLGSKGSSS